MLYLEDGKGIYCRITNQRMEDILYEIPSKLRMIIIPFNKLSEGRKQVAESTIPDSSKAVKGRRFCNFISYGPMALVCKTDTSMRP